MRELLARLLSVILSPSLATRGERRALGAVILALLLVLVLLGGIFLREGVSPGTSLLFWGICFLLAFWSVFLAYVDVKSIKSEFRSQKRDLFLSTFSRSKGQGREREEAQRDNSDRNSS